MEIFEPTNDSSNDDLYNDSTADNTTVKTAAVPAGARALIISAHSKGIYLTLNGQTPSSTEGLYIPPDVAPIFLPVIPKSNDSLKWISGDAAGSSVSIQWLR